MLYPIELAALEARMLHPRRMDRQGWTRVGNGSGQGDRILAGQELEQVAVVPGGVEAFAFDSAFFRGFAS